MQRRYFDMHQYCEELLAEVVTKRLSACLSASVEANGSGPLEASLACDDLIKKLVRHIEVVECPPMFSELLSTPFAFAAAKILRAEGVVFRPAQAEIPTAEKSVRPSPADSPPLLELPQQLAYWLSRELVELSSARRGPGNFSASIGGDGHINIVPSLAWRIALVSEQLSAGVEIFDRVLSGRSSSGQLSCWSIESAYALARPRFLELRDPDAEELLEIADTRAQQSRLMVFGAIADVELDMKPFLSGLAGKQNLPWFFARGESDLARLLTLVNNWLCPDKIATADARTKKITKRVSTGEGFSEPWLNQALSYRRQLRVASQRERPEVLVAHATKLLSDFYQIFLKPEYRNCLSAPLSKEHCSDLLNLIQLTVLQLKHVQGLLC